MHLINIGNRQFVDLEKVRYADYVPEKRYYSPDSEGNPSPRPGLSTPARLNLVFDGHGPMFEDTDTLVITGHLAEAVYTHLLGLSQAFISDRLEEEKEDGEEDSTVHRSPEGSEPGESGDSEGPGNPEDVG